MVLIVEPFALVPAAIRPCVLSSALLFGHHILAHVLCALSPGLYSITVLQVILPLAFVSGTFYSCIDAVTKSLVIKPLAIVHIAIIVVKLTIAARLVELPVTLVACSIFPDHTALPMPQAANPHAGVNSSRTVCVYFLLRLAIRMEKPT